MHGDAGQAGLAGVLNAIAVEVDPESVADVDRRRESEVDREIARTRAERERRRVVARGERCTHGVDDRDLVGARRAAEGVAAGGVGRDGRGDVVGGADDAVGSAPHDGDVDTDQPGLAEVVDAVAVGVVEHQVTDHDGLIQPRVEVGEVIVGGDREGRRLAGGRSRIRIERRVERPPMQR